MEQEIEEFNLEDLPTFLHYVLDEVELICCEEPAIISKLETYLTVIDKVVGLLRLLSLPGVPPDAETNDLKHLKELSVVFANIFSEVQQLVSTLSLRPATVVANTCVIDRKPGAVGRPRFHITSEVLEDLRSLGFSWCKIAMMLGVSRWTISRRVRDYGLEDMRGFSQISNEELDHIVRSYMDQHGTTSGQIYITGHIRSLGYRVQRSRIRELMSSKARSTKYCFEVGWYRILQSLQCTMAKFPLAFGRPPLTHKMEIDNSWLH